jgi:hypothetical protein
LFKLLFFYKIFSNFLNIICLNTWIFRCIIFIISNMIYLFICSFYFKTIHLPKPSFTFRCIYFLRHTFQLRVTYHQIMIFNRKWTITLTRLLNFLCILSPNCLLINLLTLLLLIINLLALFNRKTIKRLILILLEQFKKQFLMFLHNWTINFKQTIKLAIFIKLPLLTY